MSGDFFWKQDGSVLRVAASARGTLLGIEHSLFAAARVAAPAAAVALLAAGQASGDGLAYVQIGGGALFSLVWVVLRAALTSTKVKSQ